MFQKLKHKHYYMLTDRLSYESHYPMWQNFGWFYYFTFSLAVFSIGWLTDLLNTFILCIRHEFWFGLNEKSWIITIKIHSIQSILIKYPESLGNQPNTQIIRIQISVKRSFEYYQDFCPIYLKSKERAQGDDNIWSGYPGKEMSTVWFE